MPSKFYKKQISGMVRYAEVRELDYRMIDFSSDNLDVYPWVKLFSEDQNAMERDGTEIAFDNLPVEIRAAVLDPIEAARYILEKRSHVV